MRYLSACEMEIKMQTLPDFLLPPLLSLWLPLLDASSAAAKDVDVPRLVFCFILAVAFVFVSVQRAVKCSAAMSLALCEYLLHVLNMHF